MPLPPCNPTRIKVEQIKGEWRYSIGVGFRPMCTIGMHGIIRLAAKRGELAKKDY